MKKVFVTLLFFLYCCMGMAQQKYFEFRWNGLLGIADSAGNEVIPPVYDWKNTGINKRYIALGSEHNKALVLDAYTGSQDVMDFLSRDFFVFLPSGLYTHVHKNNRSYLMHCTSLDVIDLGKKYTKIIEEGDYLLCITTAGKTDFKRKTDLKTILSGIEQQQVFILKTEEFNNIYVLQQKNGTRFLDKDLKVITKTNQKLNTEDAASDFLQDQHHIKTISADKKATSNMPLPLPPYPYLTYSRIKDSTCFYIMQAEEQKIPLFSIFCGNENRAYAAYDNNEVTVTGKKNISFYVDIKKQVLLLPRKYWEAGGLVVSGQIKQINK